MQWMEILMIILGTGTVVGAMFKFMWSRIDKRFDAIDRRFELMDRRFELIDKKFDRQIEQITEIKDSMHELNIRIGRLETQDEERFRNEIKLLVLEKRKGE